MISDHIGYELYWILNLRINVHQNHFWDSTTISQQTDRKTKNKKRKRH